MVAESPKDGDAVAGREDGEAMPAVDDPEDFPFLGAVAMDKGGYVSKKKKK